MTDKIKDQKKINEDYLKFYKKVPDKDFSPARNKAIVEQTIVDYDAMRRKKVEEKVEGYGERADAVVSYLKNIGQAGGESNINKYFGNRMLAYLRGQEIRNKLMGSLMPKDKIIRA